MTGREELQHGHPWWQETLPALAQNTLNMKHNRDTGMLCDESIYSFRAENLYHVRFEFIYDAEHG